MYSLEGGPTLPRGGWPPPTLCSFSHSLLAECRRCLVSALLVQPARVVDPYRLFYGPGRLLLRLEVRVEEILVLENPVQPFRHHVLVAVQLLGHARQPAEGGEHFKVLARSVLAPLVRVSHDL